MLKLDFLGTGGAVPSVKRAMPAIALHWDKLFLWDCGEGTQREMMRRGVGYGSVEAIFITHLHLDHFLGVFGLIETIRMNTQREHLQVFAPRNLARVIEAMSPSFMRRPDFIKFEEMREGELYRGKDYSISAFRVEHGGNAFGLVFQEDNKRKFNEAEAKGKGLKGPMFREIQKKGFVEVGGKKIKLDDVSWERKGIKVVYSGDTQPTESVVKEAEGADLLIHDATFGEGMGDEAEGRLHTTAAGAARIAKRAGVKKLILTHISCRYADAEKELLSEARAIFKNTELAKDGMGIVVKPEKEKD
ncbi:MAG: ribonuclease Z [Candidatus Micrarchaeota archaeon]|nr:ribonuclease Z [Candidatus Micrarchaeota archaeon]